MPAITVPAGCVPTPAIEAEIGAARTREAPGRERETTGGRLLPRGVNRDAAFVIGRDTGERSGRKVAGAGASVDEGLASWRAKAAATGVSSSALLRQAMAPTGVWTPSAADVERARTRKLVRNNLNQIARWANQHKSAADAVEVSHHVAAIELALRDLARSARRS